MDLDVFDLEDVKYEDVESLIRMLALKVFRGDYDGSNPRFLAPSRRVNLRLLEPASDREK